MKYSIYQLDFYNGVRFGNGRLEMTEMTFHADTFFSALFQEALKLGTEKELLTYLKEGSLRWSDAFPYKGKMLFVPKPMFQPKIQDRQEQGNSIRKKQFKNMKYIPVSFVQAYMSGDFPEEHLEDCSEIGKEGIKTAVAVRGHEDPEPYRVSAYYFHEGNGLYIIVGSTSKEAEELLDALIDSLSYSGLGGKKSAGLGRFEYMKKKLPESFEKILKSASEVSQELIAGQYAILLSTALPKPDEMAGVFKDAGYQLIKRSGFVDSVTFDEQQMRKKDLYVLAAGACLTQMFDGYLVEERNGGKHPIYRYAYGLFLEVNV